MGTLVTMEVAVDADLGAANEALDRAFDWFTRIELSCSRFDPGSELMRLTAAIGRPVAASAMLVEAVQFALTVAEASGGAFDPTVGLRMEADGFNQHYATGRIVRTEIASPDRVSYRDVSVDAGQGTITLHRPLLLDLGAVAKGLGVDMAARELRPFRDFAVDAGGDMYLGGVSAAGAPWRVGVRHPRRDNALIGVLSVTDSAVCTSGDYERRSPDGSRHHILDPRSSRPMQDVASVTVVARTAMAADALATAAFVLGPDEGLSWLEAHEADGLMVSPALERWMTKGLHGQFAPGPSPAISQRGGSTILQDP